jgi:hypothetical protein
MSREEIIVDVAVNGSVNIDVKGMKGKACSTATHDIELVLGGQAKKKEKPEYFQPATTGQTINRKF